MYNVSDATLSDIIEELKKPNRDPREDYPKPIMQSGLINFEDLKTGMMVKGKVKNVVDFGAFIDLGIKETALLHISEISDSYVKDPLDLLKVGEVIECRIASLDEARRRISLSRKKEVSITEKILATAKKEAAKKDKSKEGTKVDKSAKGKKVFLKKASVRAKSDKSEAYVVPKEKSRVNPNDDGTKYNPFQALLHNRKGKN